MIAIEKLRAERNLPRFVFIRPTEQALRRSGAPLLHSDQAPRQCRRLQSDLLSTAIEPDGRLPTSPQCQRG